MLYSFCLFCHNWWLSLQNFTVFGLTGHKNQNRKRSTQSAPERRQMRKPWLAVTARCTPSTSYFARKCEWRPITDEPLIVHCKLIARWPISDQNVSAGDLNEKLKCRESVAVTKYFIYCRNNVLCCPWKDTELLWAWESGQNNQNLRNQVAPWYSSPRVVRNSCGCRSVGVECKSCKRL